MTRQREFVAGNQLAAIAGAIDHQRRHRLLLHADADRPLVIFEDFLQVARAVTATGVHAVEPLRISAGVIVDLELIVAADFELVRHGPHRNRVGDDLFGFQVFVGKLEAMVPESVLTGTQLLLFFPSGICALHPDRRRRALHK